MVKVLLFGQLQDLLGASQVALENLSACSVSDVRAELIAQYSSRVENVADHFAPQRGLVAVNQEMAEEETTISSGDEVAFFPPVTGG